MVSSQEKVWFVTGSSSGLGLAMTTYLLGKGNKVVATMRNPSAVADLAAKYSEDQLLVVKLDVSVASEIAHAFDLAVAKFGRVDVVYSNAGIGSVGEIESTPDDIARKQFEVNFWGSVNVAKKAFDVFRDVNKPSGGRFLQVSSVVGLVAAPGMGFYIASKHAVEGIFDTLSKELNPAWNIKITLIEFGSFRTRAMEPNGIIPTPVHPAYTTGDLPTSNVREYFASGAVKKGGADPDKASREVYGLANDDTIGLRAIIGKDSIALVLKELDSIRKDLEDSRHYSEDLEWHAT